MLWDKITRNITYDDSNKFTWGSIGAIDIESDAMKENTYFRCIKYISESVAKCPIILKQSTENGDIRNTNHRLYNKLRLRPNPYMSAIDCIRTFVALGEHKGTSGLFIDRKTMDLYPAEVRQIVIDNAGILNSKLKRKILIEFNVLNQIDYCFEEDIILYKPGITFDGIYTKSNREMLSKTLETNIKSQNYLNKLFDNGLTNKVLVQLTSDIKDEKELKKIQEKFNRLYSNDGRTFTVPAGFNVSNLNLSLSDAQFEQIRKLSRREIANCFGLSPSQIGDLQDSNNSNMQMQNIGFLTDSLLIKFQQIEQELDWKYLSSEDREKGNKCRFEESVMLRTDPKTQSEIINSYVTTGVYSLNDAKDRLGITRVEGGDDILVSSGVYKLKDLSTITTAKGGAKNEQAKGD